LAVTWTVLKVAVSEPVAPLGPDFAVAADALAATGAAFDAALEGATVCACAYMTVNPTAGPTSIDA
jgi:hypothetical protein